MTIESTERPARVPGTVEPLVVRLSDSVTIIHADCRDVLPVACDAVVTDPPYGIGFGAKHTKWSANRGTQLGDWDAEIPAKEAYSARAGGC